ncbi:phage tail tape measure protein [bacterium C-53]|nr:phage tail tape measure protein [Lachnospiraceae bacterium]NBI02202.1 phage tail tape measure protein [Lachnospiraceae bacterium]RKJ08400.1 phage tail tape measure protein [bacterium C-53]
MTDNNYDNLNKSIHKQFSNASNTLDNWASLSSILMKGISRIEKTLYALKTTDSLLTEISKTNTALSETDLLSLATNAFTTSSAYGTKANDYLSGVLKMMQEGYQTAEGLARLSSALQNAGNMSAALADQYIITADKAYGLNGNINEMTRILDGSNSIALNHTIQLSELAEAMSTLGSRAVESGLSVRETISALAAVAETTNLTGREAADAFGNILSNLRQITDADRGITSEGLQQYEEACRALGVSLTETKDGIASLREPMAILEDLSIQYHALGSGDSKFSDLFGASGSFEEATTLDTLLKNWNLYKTMLAEYENSSNSLTQTAVKIADSWEDSLTRLSNAWNQTIADLTDSDTIMTEIKGLNNLSDAVQNVTEALGSCGTFPSSKNLGRVKGQPSVK